MCRRGNVGLEKRRIYCEGNESEVCVREHITRALLRGYKQIESWAVTVEHAREHYGRWYRTHHVMAIQRTAASAA